MKRIIDKRGTGKTKQLLEYAWNTGATVVCSNPDAMKRKSEAYGFFGLKFISYYTFYLDNINLTYDEKFVIDELEDFVQSEREVIGYTLTNED